MQLHFSRLSIRQIQIVVWIFLFILTFLVYQAFDGIAQAFVYSFLGISFYIVTIYTNTLLLIPQLYQKRKIGLYLLCSIVFIIVIGAARYLSNFYIYNTFFSVKPESFRWSPVWNGMLGTTSAFICSIILYVALNYYKLRAEQDKLQQQKTEAELNLLKAQVQPHFLFNTLNNIYFYAQRESPSTALLLEKLAAMMRYFVEEAPKTRIFLRTELQFIKSYIDLENMRMRYPLHISINVKGITEDIEVPPMLFIPLIENVFKHGIDKLSNENFIDVTIDISDHLLCSVKNRVIDDDKKQTRGTGLTNLQNRLELLYKQDFNLTIQKAPTFFEVMLTIPLL